MKKPAAKKSAAKPAARDVSRPARRPARKTPSASKPGAVRSTRRPLPESIPAKPKAASKPLPPKGEAVSNRGARRPAVVPPAVTPGKPKPPSTPLAQPALVTPTKSVPKSVRRAAATVRSAANVPKPVPAKPVPAKPVPAKPVPAKPVPASQVRRLPSEPAAHRRPAASGAKSKRADAASQVPSSAPLPPVSAADQLVASVEILREAQTKHTARLSPSLPTPLPFEIPPILWEGDHSAPNADEPPMATNPPTAAEPVSKPVAPDPCRVFLIARDPHWLYAHWELPPAEGWLHIRRSKEGHLSLRLYVGRVEGTPLQEVELAPGARSWFAHVGRADTIFVAQLGYHGQHDDWTTLATSAPAVTPPETVAPSSETTFFTPPAELAPAPSPVQAAPAGPVAEAPPLVEAARPVMLPIEPPPPAPVAAPAWTAPALPGEAVAPAELELPPLTAQLLIEPSAPYFAVPPASKAEPKAASEWSGSPVPSEAEARTAAPTVPAAPARVCVPPPPSPPCAQRPSEEVELPLALLMSLDGQADSSAAPPQFSQPGGPAAPAEAGGERPERPGSGEWAEGQPETAVSGQPAKPGKFWLRVNAELVIYGATEPDAHVVVAGRQIKLRPDGSFTLRFALPNGEYELPVVAVAADQSQGRVAYMLFTRATQTLGEVGETELPIPLPSPHHA